MQENIIYKLKTLQSIEPELAWQIEKKRKLMEKISVFSVKNDIILSSNDIYSKNTKFNIRNLVPGYLAVTLSTIMVILTGGVLTVGASQSSLPGETLYPVKKVSEQVALAIASEQDKPKVEIEQAGKRLEELEKISQKASDSDQHQKVQQLVADFQQKVDSANTHLIQLSDKGQTDGSIKTKVADVAQVVNEQSEKYAVVLQKTTDSLPDTIKVKVADQVADAAKTTEKINLAALIVMVSNDPSRNNEEITARVQKTLENAEVKLNGISEKENTVAATPEIAPGTGTDTKAAVCTSKTKDTKADQVKNIDAGNVAITEEAKKELDKAKENLKNNNLIDTLKNVEEVTEITDKVTSVDGTKIVLPAVGSDSQTTTINPSTDDSKDSSVGIENKNKVKYSVDN